MRQTNICKIKARLCKVVADRFIVRLSYQYVFVHRLPVMSMRKTVMSMYLEVYNPSAILSVYSIYMYRSSRVLEVPDVCFPSVCACLA